MRKMAYIVEVTETLPIEGKDRIQIIKNAQNGYAVIGSKGIKVGDKMIYFEVDSILPEIPEFEFLRDRCYKPSLKGFLIKNMKMFKIYSNGLMVKPEDLGIRSYRIEEDFTEKLHVRKYEPEEDTSPIENKLPSWKKNLKNFLMHYSATRWLGKRLFIKAKISGDFPSYLISKSDEDNIQNNKHWFDMYKNDNCYISCKMEGCVSEDTIVITEDGKKTIKEVYDTQYNGKILSYNEEKKKTEMKEIISASRKPTDKKTVWYELETEYGEKLKITGNDKLYLPKLKCYRTVEDIFNMDVLPEILLS